MLHVTWPAKPRGSEALPADEDRALRQTFGRRADPASRVAGEAVVRQYRQRTAGCWFLCDCLGDVERPPKLVPDAESHLRRQAGAEWPEHNTECDFYRDATEQQAITASFDAPPRRGPFDLMAGFRDAPKPFTCEPVPVDYGQARGALASVLMSLLARADLNRLEPGGKPGLLREHYARLHRAAKPVELEKGLLLSRFLCTYPPALHELIGKIEQAAPGVFPASGRPHGMLIGIFSGAAKGMIQPARGEGIAVRGEIAVFGEATRYGDGVLDAGGTGPYVGIGLVGRASEKEAVEVLEAYLHPIAGPGYLMPVDGNRQRATLAVLIKLEKWLRHNTSVRIHIEKPLFNISGGHAPDAGGAEVDQGAVVVAEAGEVREPCIPDFIVRKAKTRPGTGIVIVEVTDNSDKLHRARKLRTQAAIKTALSGLPLVEHDLCLQVDVVQEETDRTFWRRLRATIGD